FAFASALIACLIKNLAGFPENMAGMDLTISYFGLQMIEFAIFNLIFLGNVYKNPIKSGLRFVISAFIYFLVYAICEFPVWTYRSFIKKMAAGQAEELNLIAKIGQIFTGHIDSILPQVSVLFVGILLYILSWILSYKRACKQFEKYDM
ncbi:MAG: hypothetical protein K6C97_00560, partial [Treponema sp.]|nr:hypothetical protein [Treponema sp.]